MTPERWQRIDAVLQAALDVDGRARDAVIQRECQGDEVLRREVVSLLAEDAGAKDFLERDVAPALGDVRPVADRLAQALAQAAWNQAALAAPDPHWSPAGEVAGDGGPPASAAPPNTAPPSAAGTGTAGARPARLVSARSAMYVSLLMLVVGFVGGWMLPRLLDALRLPKRAAAVVMPALSALQFPALEPGVAVMQVVDRTGQPVRSIAATRPWTPRISPDGRRVVFGAFGEGRTTSDLWVADLDAGAPRRLTEDAGDSNDPQWSRDGKEIAFSVNAPGGKDVFALTLADASSRRLFTRPSWQYPSDWGPDGSVLVISEEPNGNRRDILVRRREWSLLTPFAATAADEHGARLSPDGRWIAYTSDVSGEPMVYLDSFTEPGQPMAVSRGAGQHPVWRGDGLELFYWSRETLMSATLSFGAPGSPPIIRAQTPLFSAPFADGPNTMYDVTPDGSRFVIIRRP
jgi:hypothetical protein